jgi:hypothetical protein
MKNEKKAAEPKTVETSAARNVYTLTAKGKEKATAKDLKVSTHIGATLLALRKLGKGTAAEIVAEVLKEKKIETKMKIPAAVRWVLFDGQRRELIAAK